MVSVSDLQQDFQDMKVIGQFNLGFIIVLWRGQLFICDQHACDEKFKYVCRSGS